MITYINGPSNYIKLQGKINNIEKNIIIYYDDLENINNNKKCKNNSIDIDKYLINLFKSSDKYIDFFIEINKDFININKNNDNNNNDNNNLTYYSKLELFFKSEFNDKKVPFLRLHWNNVSSNKFIFELISFNIFNYLISNIQIINSLINENKYSIINGFNFNISFLNTLLNFIYQIKNNINIFNDILNVNNNNNNNNENNIKNNDKNDMYFYTLNFIKKIKFRYNNKNIINIINPYFNIINDHIILINKNIDYIIKKLNKYIKFYNNKIHYKINIYPFYDNLPNLLFKIINKLTKIYYIINIINNILNDIYTIRRILDKNYITNSIIYSNSNILINYLYSFVNLFDFKIIDISYSDYSVNVLYDKIKKIKLNKKYLYYTAKLLDIYKLKKQCIEINH